jgi:hypothetical protein
LVASVEKIADFHQQIIWKPLKPHSFTRKQRGCQLKKLFFSSENAGFIKKHHQHLELNGIPIPIGSMVLVYMLTWLGYIDGIHVTMYSTMDPSWVGPSPFWDLVDLINKTTDLTNQIINGLV